MKFSVDQESVSDIISALTSYSDDIDSEFRKFEDEIKKIAIKTNYNKLLYALQGIIDIYNDVICGSMRKQLIAQWIEEGESLHSFAEDVYMGEESEEAVKKIENSLEEIFNGYIGNNLIDLEFAGDANAAKTDFDDVVELFESFSREVDRIKEETSNYFERKIEDNELYRFLIPIIESIAVGVSSFSSTAKVELDRLGDNYVERMEEAKQRVEEAKKEKTSVDFDLDLFDFEDDFVNIGTMPNTIGSVANSSAAVQENKKRSMEHIKNIGRRMQQDFAPERKDRKPIEEIIEYANADNLVSDILKFSSAECKWFRKDPDDNELILLEKSYNEGINQLKEKYRKKLNDCRQSQQKKLDEIKERLKKKIINQIFEKAFGVKLYQRYLDRENEKYNKENERLEQEHKEKCKKVTAKYNEERKKIENHKCSILQKCKRLYDKKNACAKSIQNGDKKIIEFLTEHAKKILKECNYPCGRFAKIFQDLYLSEKPRVLGFSCEELGHRITINEKRKTWIDVNLDADTAQSVLSDGILNMKTPIHEYLHYLSNGKDGTSGVKNMKIIKGIADKEEQEILSLAMTGFNEGITEMFAQDYLRDEFQSNNNFINPNKELAQKKEIVLKGSYNPQVSFIRKICEILGNSDSVKDAYIAHDFSIIENELTRVFSLSGKSLDWTKIKKLMAEIQSKYAGRKPTNWKASNADIWMLKRELMKMLEV